MLRRKKQESLNTPPSIDPATFENNKSEVLETLANLDIPRDRLIITGSAALTLLGLERRAHDLDLFLHPDDLQKAFDEEILPNGLIVSSTAQSRPNHLHLQVPSTPLPTELISHQSPMDKSTFNDFLKWNTIQLADGVSIQRPSQLRLAKAKSIRLNTRSDPVSTKLLQDRYDAALLQQHIDLQFQHLRGSK